MKFLHQRKVSSYGNDLKLSKKAERIENEIDFRIFGNPSRANLTLKMKN
jgi:hypothetical protein